MTRVLTADNASRFARLALGHVAREYPNKLDHVLRGPEDLRAPRELHPVFHGSFDWHSCVHGYWLLATLLRRFPALRERLAVRAIFDGRMTPENVAGEVAYMRQPGRAGFERPYGWAWLLMLAAELARHEDERGRRWYAALAPLATAFAERFAAYLPKATYPVRAGTHANSAFALALAAEYASACGDAKLAALVRERARAWFASDEDRQVWEPDGEDFLSPVLVEAECMRRVLPVGEYAAWLRRFLPGLETCRPAALFEPATVSDRADGRIAHLDGLNLSRAWCFRSIAGALVPEDARRAPLLEAAESHLAAALPHLAEDYVGEHWLATFAVLALSTADERVSTP
ncbi:MAG TPA: DUF2891 domain-containing protein [Candidatus Elarobacter sp.]|nr:DUF2891 domain-containing protein [Candidatus Elarobacter sp.]